MTLEYARPRALPEALELLARHGADAKVLAGGTAGVILLRQGLIAPSLLVDIGRLPALDGIRAADGGLRIGPLARLRAVEHSPEVRRMFPALARACGVVGNVRVRGQATLGGNLAEADYASDPPAVLLALNGEVEASSRRGARRILLSEFFRGFYETALAPDELITGVFIPAPRGAVRMTYLKFQTRSAADRPALGVAAVAQFAGGLCRDLRVAVGAACAVPRRLPEVEAQAHGHTLDDEVIAGVAEGYARAIDTLDDLRGSAWYRTQMIRVHVRRALEELRDGRR